MDRKEAKILAAHKQSFCVIMGFMFCDEGRKPSSAEQIAGYLWEQAYNSCEAKGLVGVNAISHLNAFLFERMGLSFAKQGFQVVIKGVVE
jgi:methionine salvage enolase-phosphatase E1